MEAGRAKAKEGDRLCFLLPLHFSEGLPLLPDKEVHLGSSFYNWREGYSIMRGRTLSWLQKLLFTRVPLSANSCWEKDRDYGTQSYQREQERLGCLAFGDLE